MTTLAAHPSPLSGPTTRPLGRVGTVPNVVTAVRTVASVAIGLTGVAADRPVLLLVAYAVYWLGDIADGWIARRLGQETRLGAVFDIISDRACTAVLCVGVVAHTPGVTLVVGVFLLTFLVVDAMLSLAFLCWPIDTPNDFCQVDRLVYRLNWSPLAKAANTAGVVCALALGATTVGLLIAAAVLVLKVWSAARVLRLLES